MTRKALSIIVALHIIIVFSGLSFAGMGGGRTFQLNIPKRAIGEVAVIDIQTRTITIGTMVNENVVPVTVVVDDKTNFLKGSEKKTFSDVKVGDNVMIKYIELNGRNMARLVVIGRNKE